MDVHHPLSKILFGEVGSFRCFGQRLCYPSFRGKLVAPLGARREKSFDWAERELLSLRGGRATHYINVSPGVIFKVKKD